ncbi:MAG: hypothetical protein MH204_08960, partial [Fimbriimonadaceae bacterium]|nr:hypothetical protein [Fimbriimonadaceae bacterium]
RRPPILEQNLVVPNGGLQIVDEGGRPLGSFNLTSNGLSLIMLSRGGGPGVQIEAGGGGQIVLGANANSAGLLVRDPRGNEGRFLIQGGTGVLGLTTGGRKAELRSGDAGGILVESAAGRPLFQVATLPSGGGLSLYSRSGEPYLSATTNQDGARVILRDRRESRSADLSPMNLILKQGDSQVWQAPPAEVSR